MTDSELVPWGKGEKNPQKGNEIESETVCIQAVGAEVKIYNLLYIEYFSDCVPFV